MSGNIGKRTDAEIANYMAVKDGRKSRYSELFGTPERAAWTIMDKQLTYDLLEQCDDCPYQTDECFEPSGKCAMDDYDTLLEWLRGDAE